MSNEKNFEISKNDLLKGSDFDNDLNLIKPDCKSKTVILFYSPQCGHCVRFKPEYVDFMNDVNNGKYGSDMSAKAINTAEARDFMQKMFSKPDEREYLIEGVPAVVSYENGKYFSTYGPGEGEEEIKKYRSKRDLVDYIKGVGSAPITYKE